MKRDLAVLVLLRVLASAAQAVTLILVGRASELSVFGQLNALSGAALVLYAVADLGVGQFIGRARAKNRAEEVAASLLLNSLTSAAAFGFSLLLLLPIHLQWSMYAAFALLSLAFALEKNLDTHASVMIADGRRWRPGISLLIRRGVALLTVFTALALGTPSIWAFAAGYMFGCLGALWLSAQFLRQEGLTRGRPAWHAVKRLPRQTFPFMVSFVAGQLRTLDVGLVALGAGPQSSGLYAAATRLTNPLQLVPTALAQLLLPRAVQNGPAYARRMSGFILLAGCGGVALALPLAFFGDRVLAWLYGPQYAGSGQLLFIATVGMVAVSVAGPLSSLLQAVGDEKFVAAWALGATVAALVVGLGLAVIGGATGAATGVAAAFILRVIVMAVRLNVHTDTGSGG